MKARKFIALPVFVMLLFSLNVFAQAVEELEPADGVGRECPSGNDGICRTKTEDGGTRKICVDLVGSETANCNK